MAGNDPEAQREFQQRYGQAGNAEEIIREARTRYSHLLQTTQHKRVDVEASEALVREDLEKALGHQVEGHAVYDRRDPVVVYVWNKDDGTVGKDAIRLTDMQERLKAPTRGRSRAEA